MFDELSTRFEDAVKSLRGQASINEENVEQYSSMKELIHIFIHYTLEVNQGCKSGFQIINK